MSRAQPCQLVPGSGAKLAQASQPTDALQRCNCLQKLLSLIATRNYARGAAAEPIQHWMTSYPWAATASDQHWYMLFTPLQDMFCAIGVCKSWRAAGHAMFFKDSWGSGMQTPSGPAIQHPAQLITLVSFALQNFFKLNRAVSLCWQEQQLWALTGGLAAAVCPVPELLLLFVLRCSA